MDTYDGCLGHYIDDLGESYILVAEQVEMETETDPEELIQATQNTREVINKAAKLLLDDTPSEWSWIIFRMMPVIRVKIRKHSYQFLSYLACEEDVYYHIKKMVVFKARGLMPPVFTPLNSDLTINYSAIPSYAKYLASNGIKSVLVGGTSGEHMSLRVSDRKKVIDAWIEARRNTSLHIQVQVGGAPLPDVLELASYCASVGVDSILTLPELYFKPKSVEELVSYVALVAEAAPTLPVLYYHIPSNTHVAINMPAFVEAASSKIPNFKGIKFTSNDLTEGAQVRQLLKGDQEMFLGSDWLLAPAALLGIKSSIGTSFNLFPRLAQDILDAVETNDVTRARDLQQKLSTAVDTLTAEGAWVPVMKAGMEIVTGLSMGPPSLPQKPISSAARSRIQNRLRELGLTA